MATSYTSNKKIGALDSASTPLAATNEIVINQNGDILKTPLSAVEAKVFDAKTAKTAVDGTEVVVVRQTDNTLRQVPLNNIVKGGPGIGGLITNDMVSDSAAIADSKLATINTAGKVTNTAVQATPAISGGAYSNALGANKIVTRDGSGNFAAGTITATLSGNATTATTLQTGRTIALTGDVTYTSPSFNGSANVTAASTIANNAVTTAKIADGAVTSAKIADGTIVTADLADGAVTSAKIADGTIVNGDIANTTITDAKLATISTAGKVNNSATTATSANTASAIVARDASGNFSAGTITASLTGNSSTATTLATGRTIALTGDVTGTTGAFNGSANVSAATTIANNAVTTVKIAAANVTTAKIADANVTTAKIADANVTTAKIADANVTTAKVANDAIDNTKIRNSAALSVIGRSANSTGDPADIAAGTDGHVLRRSGTALGFGQVATAGITDSAVTTAKIADANVTDAKIASGVDASKLTTGTLPADRIGSSAITTARINDGAVTAAKLNGAQTGSAPIYGCRAWVNFNGTRNATNTGASSNGANVLIRASGNVSSVLKNGTGDYTITFTTAMPNANYSFAFGSGADAVIGVPSLSAKIGVAPTTTQLRVVTDNGANQAMTNDIAHCCVQVFA